MAERSVGNYRPPRGRGASVRVPPRDRHQWLASAGRIFLAVFGLGLTGLIGFGIKEAFVTVNAQKISMVQIEGALHFLSRSELEDTVNRFVATSLVALDLEVLKHELEAEPWVSRAEVRRQWPDRLIIRIEEEVAIARWGKGQLLNQQGRVFQPDNIAEQMQLPYLSGPAGTESMVMQQYQQFNQLLYPLGVRMRDLELNERGAWTITFMNTAQNDNLVQVRVGRDDVLERMRRLVTLLESEALTRMPLISGIDLRYGNGLAVTFREDDATGQDTGTRAGLVVR
ncbi:MAG: cell division protein FtsQ/DivIB [Pseudohongiellaceae bacterium]